MCHHCGHRGHWAAECPKRGEARQGGKGDGKSGQLQKPTAFEGYGNHCWKWGLLEKDCFTLAKRAPAKVARTKELAVLMKPGQAIWKKLRSVDLVCARCETHVMTETGANVAKRHARWTVARLCPQHRKHLEPTIPRKFKNRNHTQNRSGSTSARRRITNVAALTGFPSCTCSRSVCVSVKRCATKGFESFWTPSHDTVASFTSTRTNGSE